MYYFYNNDFQKRGAERKMIFFTKYAPLSTLTNLSVINKEVFDKLSNFLETIPVVHRDKESHIRALTIMDEEPGLHLHVELHVLGDKVCVDARHRLTTILGNKYSPTNKFYF